MTKERFLSGDRAILVLLIFNIVLFTAVFLYDYTRYGYKGNQKVIGTILFKSNSIQRKFDSEVVWKEIEMGNSIQNRDTILTTEGSQAKLRLLDGTEIMIAENSMIFIDYLDNRANLEISVGGLQVTRRPENKANPSSLGIRSGDGVLKLVEGIVNVEKKKNQKNLEYAVLSGSIKADPSNPILLYPKKSLEGFEKLFPISASLQTTEGIQSTPVSSSSGNTGSSSSSYSNNNTSGSASTSNSSSKTNPSSSRNSSDPINDPNDGKYDNGNPNYRTSTGSNGNSNSNSNSGNPAGNGQNGLNTKSGLKLEKTSSGNSSTQSENKNGNNQNNGSESSRTGYDPGDYLKKQKYEQNKIQEKSDPSAPKSKTGTSKSESPTENKSGSSTYQEVKKPKPPRELTPEEIQKQEKEKRRREREDQEQREFLRM